MRFLLQDIDNSRFMDAEGKWVADCRDARCFDRTYHAMLTGLEIPNPTQIVLCFDAPGLSMFIATRCDGRVMRDSCSKCPKNGGARETCTPDLSAASAALSLAPFEIGGGQG